MLAQSFRLIRQRVAEPDTWAGEVEIGAGPCRWVTGAERVEAVDGAGDGSGDGEAILFEAAAKAGAMLMIAPEGRHIRVNGRPVALVGLVRIGDEIVVDGEWRLHVTMHRPSPVGVAGESERDCPVCRGRIAAGGRVFRCGCGTAMHWEEGTDAMDCAAVVGQCPVCRAKVVAEGGYAWLPEGRQ